jgi:hypothetical protein
MGITIAHLRIILKKFLNQQSSYLESIFVEIFVMYFVIQSLELFGILQRDGEHK